MTDPAGTVYLAAASVDALERLFATATDVARTRGYRLHVTTVVEVPPSVPLSEGEAVRGETHEATHERAEELLAASSVPGDATVRYARSIVAGIVGGANEADADILLLGWRGRPPRRDVVLGSYVDAVLRNAPCDILVQRIQAARPSAIETVLVPVAVGPHNALARETACDIAASHDATVRLLHVLDPDADDDDREAAETLLEGAAEECTNVQTETRLVTAEHVSGAITDHTADVDLTILGATEEPILKRKLLGTVADGVARHGDGTVMLAQADPTSRIDHERLI